MNKTLKKGFTLVELLIVMVILGILTTIVASSFSSSQEKARDTRRKSDLAAVAKAIEVYFNDKGEYPPSNGGNIDTFSWGDEFSDANGTIYMIKLPEEKTSARSYYYLTEGGQNQTYAIFTRLENDLDKDIPINPIGEAYQYYQGTNCGAGFSGCNYAISSSNTTPDSFATVTLTDEP
jgi:general secretion pathway protein G